MVTERSDRPRLVEHVDVPYTRPIRNVLGHVQDFARAVARSCPWSLLEPRGQYTLPVRAVDSVSRPPAPWRSRGSQEVSDPGHDAEDRIRTPKGNLFDSLATVTSSCETGRFLSSGWTPRGKVDVGSEELGVGTARSTVSNWLMAMFGTRVFPC